MTITSTTFATTHGATNIFQSNGLTNTKAVARTADTEGTDGAERGTVLPLLSARGFRTNLRQIPNVAIARYQTIKVPWVTSH